MYPMTIYMAGPIFQCGDGEAKNWRDHLVKTYGRPHGETGYADFIFLDPMRRDYRGKEAESVNRIVHLDKLDIDRSDVVIVYYHKPSVGTSMEILYAWERNVPVIVVTTEKEYSPWLLYHATAIVESFDEAMDEIRSIP